MVEFAVRTDGDDPATPGPVTPLPFQREIAALADYLQNGPLPGRIGAENHSLAAIDTSGKLARDVAQRFERKRNVGLVTPGAEEIVVILMLVVMTMLVADVAITMVT
jgi:hypothetical protein